MGYTSWFRNHAEKHARIVAKLRERGMSMEEIIDYFDFDNMIEAEPEFCPLYTLPAADGRIGKRCHDLVPLNCYLCACPLFRFSDRGFGEVDGKQQHSFCSVDSKHGRQGVYGEVIHQDCTKCTVPHRHGFVRRNYDVEWTRIMRKCDRDNEST